MEERAFTGMAPIRFLLFIYLAPVIIKSFLFMAKSPIIDSIKGLYLVFLRMSNSLFIIILRFHSKIIKKPVKFKEVAL